MSLPTLRGFTAVALVFGLILITSSGTLLAGTPSTLTGRVLAPNGSDPRAGVVVTLVDVAAEKTYKSDPTDARGGFAISAAPAGSYALLVETPEGAFLASNNVQLAPGVNRPVALALKPGKQGQPPSGTSTPAGSQKAGLPTWAKWVIAGGVVIGALIVVDAVTKDNKEASSF